MVPLRSVLARSAYFFATIGVGFAWLGSSDAVDDQVTAICSTMTTRHECESFPMLEPGMCAAAKQCIDDPTSSGCEGFLQPNFECKWRPNEKLNNWTRAIAPAAYVQGHECVRSRCPLFEYATGIALEFALILLTLCYVSSFGLHDVKRLLDRPPRAPGDGKPQSIQGAAAGPADGPLMAQSLLASAP
jgi:hypothetical protein